ncbi:hypothetical protein C0J50_14103 [Silurus asotus]|uniref:Uncharacterized protein n=1 Tax=Silurus asotus TaxID=30991 RepID=A0AAD5B319_SILAS|nr:hypothetical protein C0J50_14103 [Silurus asotus]
MRHSSKQGQVQNYNQSQAKDDQYLAAPQDPYLRLGCASRRLPGTSAGVTYLTPITLPAPELTISTHEEADADSAAHGVSLEALDPVEMETVRCGSLQKRDPRRAPITDYTEDLESLLSLNEEEEGSDSQIFPFTEVQSPLQSHSMSVPSLCVISRENHPSLAKQRPHSHAQAHSSLSSLLGGSTQSLQVDAELGSEFWDNEETTEGHGLHNEESEKPNGLRSLVRSLSFLGKMARNYKISVRFALPRLGSCQLGNFFSDGRIASAHWRSRPSSNSFLPPPSLPCHPPPPPPSPPPPARRSSARDFTGCGLEHGTNLGAEQRI